LLRRITSRLAQSGESRQRTEIGRYRIEADIRQASKQTFGRHRRDYRGKLGAKLIVHASTRERAVFSHVDFKL
jgi:hypothetical protein